jgi:hypothetical protein
VARAKAMSQGPRSGKIPKRRERCRPRCPRRAIH